MLIRPAGHADDVTFLLSALLYIIIHPLHPLPLAYSQYSSPIHHHTPLASSTPGLFTVQLSYTSSYTPCILYPWLIHNTALLYIIIHPLHPLPLAYSQYSSPIHHHTPPASSTPGLFTIQLSYTSSYTLCILYPWLIHNTALLYIIIHPLHPLPLAYSQYSSPIHHHTPLASSTPGLFTIQLSYTSSYTLCILYPWLIHNTALLYIIIHPLHPLPLAYSQYSSPIHHHTPLASSTPGLFTIQLSYTSSYTPCILYPWLIHNTALLYIIIHPLHPLPLAYSQYSSPIHHHTPPASSTPGLFTIQLSYTSSYTPCILYPWLIHNTALLYIIIHPLHPLPLAYSQYSSPIHHHTPPASSTPGLFTIQLSYTSSYTPCILYPWLIHNTALLYIIIHPLHPLPLAYSQYSSPIHHHTPLASSTPGLFTIQLSYTSSYTPCILYPWLIHNTAIVEGQE